MPDRRPPTPLERSGVTPMMHTQDLIRKRPITTPQHQPRRRQVLLVRVGGLVDYWSFAAGLATGCALAYTLITH
jgi:hypothetical protein